MVSLLNINCISDEKMMKEIWNWDDGDQSVDKYRNETVILGFLDRNITDEVIDDHLTPAYHEYTCILAFPASQLSQSC